MSDSNENIENSISSSIEAIEESANQTVEEIAKTLAAQSISNVEENILVNNFVEFFEPLIKKLDAHVEAVRLSQCQLSNQIKTILNEISVIYEEEKKKLDLEDYVRRLNQSKKRLNTVQATVISVQERLNRIYVNIQKDPYLKQYKEQKQLTASASNSAQNE